MPPSLVLRYCAVVFLVAAAVAQRPVLTVGGTNPQFFDLPAAVAAAMPGSIIECRPGIYTGFVTDKPLRIVAESVQIQPPAGADYAIEIRDLLGTDAFVFRGVNVDVIAGNLGGMTIRNTSAPVILESVNVFSFFGLPGLDVFNTGTVHVSRSILVGSPGLQANLANLVSSENVVASATGAGAVITNTLLESVRSIYVGTDNPALRVFDCDARLSSDGTGGMIVFGTPPSPVSPVEVKDSFLQWKPSRFLLGPYGGAPALSKINSVEVNEEVPCLTAGPGVLGSTASARVTLENPAVGLLAVSFLRPLPVVLAATGIYVDLPPAVLAAGGVVDSAGLQFDYTLPPDPVLRGELFAFQAITLPASGVTQLSGVGLWYLE